MTHVRFVFPYEIILVPSAISPYHVTQLDTLQPPDVALKTWCPELNSMFQRASDRYGLWWYDFDLPSFTASSLCQFSLLLWAVKLLRVLHTTDSADHV